MSILDRFLAKVNKTDSCWLWTAATTGRTGYGQFWNGKKVMLAHRWSYEHYKGQIEAGKVVDHLCRTHGCVNPEHLRVCTQTENTLCGIGPIAQNAKATHCPKGHEYTHANTSVRKNGHRDCRACKKETDKIWHKKRWERIKEWEALKEENARLQKLVDMNQKVIDAAREFHEFLGDGDNGPRSYFSEQWYALDAKFREMDAPRKGVTSPSEGVDGENKELPENVCQWCLEKNCTVC